MTYAIPSEDALTHLARPKALRRKGWSPSIISDVAALASSSSAWSSGPLPSAIGAGRVGPHTVVSGAPYLGIQGAKSSNSR